jgi:hypothetical protein
MATETSNIDDLLMGVKTNTQPETPESAGEYAEDTPELEQNEEPESPDIQEDEQEEEENPKQELDDYGNTKQNAKTYTEEEVNERINKAIRDRLSRGNQQQQPNQQQIQQQAQGFEHDPNSSDDWQKQLETFVEQTVSRMTQKQTQQQQQALEQQAQFEFETKFTNGIEKFGDFRDVVGAQPITDPMTYALRGMKDPAAFIYAASKRQPEELQRISNIQDPYAQIVEMGKLEERMRKNAPATNAPRPISRTKEDSGLPASSKKKELSIDDLLTQADAKKRSMMEKRRR